MTSLGFTGTRNTGPYEDRLWAYVRSADFQLYLDPFDTFVTGGCKGWDAFIGRFLAQTRQDARHVVLVPWNKSQVDPWWEEFDPGLILVVYMPEGTDYRYRNTEIVRRSERIFYCADKPEDDGGSKRSGTWMTKRIAEQADLPVDGIILNGETNDTHAS